MSYFDPKVQDDNFSSAPLCVSLSDELGAKIVKPRSRCVIIGSCDRVFPKKTGPARDNQPFGSHTWKAPKSPYLATQIDEPPLQSSISWTSEQTAIIDFPVTRRVIVDAGPGTGKTAVAAARVAALVQSGTSANRIWIISFTRTAVREIRDRVQLAVGEAAFELKISTLDSHAAQLLQGFTSSEAGVFRDFNKNICDAIHLLRNDADAREFVSRIDHLVIDEAQDLFGERAELILAIIDAMPTAGVTAFTDDAQSIFGYARDPANAGSQRGLPELLRLQTAGFEQRSLTTTHRTQSPELVRLFTTTRSFLLDQAHPGLRKLEVVQQSILQAAKTVEEQVYEELRGEDNLLVLYRRRVDVLTLSSYLSASAPPIPHRVRLPNVPRRIDPALALLFWDYPERRMNKSEYLKRFSERVAGELCTTSPELLWKSIVRYAGVTETVADLHALRACLAGTPPLEFLAGEVGARGPILGTIHSSKGREAESVRLVMPTTVSEDLDPEEEARILFVGATRARNLLEVVRQSTYGTGKLKESGRYFRCRSKAEKAAFVEFGREGDLDETAQTSTNYFENSDDAHASQEAIRQLLLHPITTTAVKQKKDGPDGKGVWTHALLPQDSTIPLGFFSRHLEDDLYQICREIKANSTSSVIRYCHLIDARTSVFSPDDPELAKLHLPWQESGFMLAPVLFCSTKVWMNK